MTKIQKISLVLIILLAIFFRFYQIQRMPGGLFPDEAANGLDINLMQQGHLQPFYERGNGREALFFYMEWGSVALFGKGPWQHHIVSSTIGVLSVLLCFLFTRKLFSMETFNEDEFEKSEKNKTRAIWIALLAAFLMAVSTWHVVLSRTAFRAILIPLFATLTLYLLLLTYEAVSLKKGLLFAALTGASFALGFYTYIAYRMMVFILIMLLLWPLLAKIRQKQLWQTIKSYKFLVASFLLAFVVFIYPIAKYFYQHPGSFVGRAGQVSVFNPSLYTINGQTLVGTPVISQVLPVVGEVFKTQMAAFFTHGDLNWRSNISGLPFLSPLVSPFFGVCLLVVIILGIWYFFTPLKRQKYWKYFLLTGWFFGMMLPVITTAEGIPHGLRSIGVIPSVFIISALGLYEFGSLVMKLHNRLWSFKPKALESPTFPEVHINDQNNPQDQSNSNKHLFKGYGIVVCAFKAVIILFCVGLIFQSYFYYFVYAANSPENFYYFRSDLTPVSCYLNYYGQKQNTYLVLDKFSVQTPDYETEVDGGHPSNPRNNPYIQVDPEDSWKLPTLQSGDQVVFTQSSIFDIKKFKQYHPETNLTYELRNKFGQAVLAVYTVPNMPNGFFRQEPFDYSASGLIMTSQCQSLFGPHIKLY